MSGRESFSLQKVIQVRYRNESGVDEGGLKRDFFSILMAQLLASNLLTQYTDNVAYSSSANVLALQQGQYTTIGILNQCKRTGTATRPVHNDWDTQPVRTYWHCNKASTQRLGYSTSANVLAMQQGQYTTWDTHPVRTYWHYNKASTQRGILTQCERTGTTTRPVHNVGYSTSANVLAMQQGQYTTWDTHPVRTYWHYNKASTQRGILNQCKRTGNATRPVHNVGYSPSANVLAMQQGQYTTIGILTQCERTGTTTRPVHNDWDTQPVQTYWHCNKASTQRLGYSSSANVLALQQGQYTTIGILTQCERTGTATRTVHNDWDTHPVQTYWHCNKASTQRLGYSSSANVLALQQGQYTTWDTHPVRTYWHYNKASTQRLGYSTSANVLALQQGQYTTWDTHPVQTYWHCNKDSTQRLGYSPSANVLALQQGQYTTWDTHPVRTYWHCNKASTQRLGYSTSANVLALQQGQYTTIGILTQCERTGTATRPVHNDWDTQPVRTYWHCNKDSTQRLGYSTSANVLAMQQGQYTTWDTQPVRTYWHCNKASTQRLGYSTSANVLALQQGQYTTIGILNQCKRTGTATRTVHNDWDTQPVRTYWHCNKASTQRLGYSTSANVLALQQGQYTTIGILTQCERTGTATRTVHNDWDTQPVQTYWQCNKASTQRGILTQCERTGTTTRPVHNVGYSPSANVLALQQGQYTTWDTHPVRTYWHCNKASIQRSAAWWRRCSSKERACHPSSATCLYNTACTDACYSRYLWQANICRQYLIG